MGAILFGLLRATSAPCFLPIAKNRRVLCSLEYFLSRWVKGSKFGGSDRKQGLRLFQFMARVNGRGVSVSDPKSPK